MKKSDRLWAAIANARFVHLTPGGGTGSRRLCKLVVSSNASILLGTLSSSVSVKCHANSSNFVAADATSALVRMV